MQQVIQIFKKEFKTYFVSPIAYIVIAIFLLISGWLYFNTFFVFNQADLRSFFNLLPFTFAFIVPAVTMRLFSEEFNVGSYETLLTLPVTYRDVILGKFLAGVAFVAAMMIPTLSYAVTVALLGNLDWGPAIGGFIGAVFLGGAFSAIGLFASSLTRNQIIAFIIGVAICFFLALLNKMLFFLPKSLLTVLAYLGVEIHFQNIAKGIVDSRDIIYFLSLIFISLYGAHLSMQERC